MRDIYHDELDDIGKRVIEMTKLVAIAMERATQALLDANLALADQVIADDRRIDALRAELEDRSFQLIAQQQPVATDLRVLISTIHLGGDLERMGDLALPRRQDRAAALSRLCGAAGGTRRHLADGRGRGVAGHEGVRRRRRA